MAPSIFAGDAAGEDDPVGVARHLTGEAALFRAELSTADLDRDGEISSAHVLPMLRLAREKLDRPLPTPRSSAVVPDVARSGDMLAFEGGGFGDDATETRVVLQSRPMTLLLLGVLGSFAVQVIASFAIIRYFMTRARDGFHRFKTLVAPVAGGLAQLGACYLLIANRGELAGAGDVFFVKAIPWIVLIVVLLGGALAVWMKTGAQDGYARIGSIEHGAVPTAVRA